MCTTSKEAYRLAVKLCEDYERRKKEEKELNLRKEEAKAGPKEGDATRTVTEIDYGKHERTIKELERQEKEEEFARKKTEAAQWCTLDHEHGPNCRRPVGGCSHDHQKEWAIYEKSTMEKIEAADRFRQEGNEAYRKHNYGLAAVHYRKALLQFDYTFAETPEEEKALEKVKLACLLNVAACKCQQEEWDDVLTQCRLALEIDPRSVKAYYRTGLAHLSRDKFDLAKDALMSAYEIEPHNPEVLSALKQLKHKMATYKVRQKEVFREMLSGGEPDAAEAAAAADAASGAEGAAAAGAAGATSNGMAEEGGVGELAAAAVPAPEEAARLAEAALAREVASEAPEAPEGVRRRRGPANTAEAAAPSASLGDPATEHAEEELEEEKEADEGLSRAHKQLLNGLLLAALLLLLVAAAALLLAQPRA